jgi:hypothetical protein
VQIQGTFERIQGTFKHIQGTLRDESKGAPAESAEAILQVVLGLLALVYLRCEDDK